MMGLYRFLLAQTVLLSHFGGIPSEASRVAVYSFFTISGFLIFRVLDTKYINGLKIGVGAFFINRFLRLFPLYIVLAFLANCLARFYPNGFDIGPGSPNLHVLNARGVSILSELLFFIPHFDFSGIIPVINSAGPALPQMWSVGIEIYFYMLAPMILILLRKDLMRWLFMVATLFAVFISLFVFPNPNLVFEDAIYKNLFPAMFMFVSGGLIWQIRKIVDINIGSVKIFFALIGYFWFLLFWSNSKLFIDDFNPLKFLADVIISLPFTLLVVFSVAEGSLKKISDGLGELSYGIYVNQYIIAFLMMLANEFCARKFNWNNIFGAGYNRLEFGIHTAIFSTVFAYISYITIERYIEKLRKRISSSNHIIKEQVVLCH